MKVLFLILFLFLVCNYHKIGYSPMPWNDKKHKKFNNCYSYAMNDPDPSRTSKRIPGETSDLKRDKKNYTCSHYERLIQSDYPGLMKVDSLNGCSHGISMVLDPNGKKKDFHFYRFDDGVWSHKRGDNKVSKVDSNGDLITDPKTAGRDYGKYEYDKFCGYYCLF